MATEAWDIAVPAASDPINTGDADIREFKEQIEDRLNKEHANLGNSGAGGEHVAGSAICFRQDADPTTTLDNGSLDNGRLYVDSTGTTEVMKVHDGSDWVDLSYLQTVATVSSGDALDITNSGSDNCIDLHQASTGVGLNITTTATGAFGAVITTAASSSVAGLTVNTGVGAAGAGISVTGSTTANGMLVANTSSGNGLFVTNAGAGKGIKVAQSGASAGRGIDVTATGSTDVGIYVTTATAGIGMHVVNPTSNQGIKIDNSDAGEGLRVDLTGSGAGTGVLISAGSASSTATGLTINMAVSDESHIHMDTSGQASSVAGDIYYDGTNFKLHTLAGVQTI